MKTFNINKLLKEVKAIKKNAILKQKEINNSQDKMKKEFKKKKNNFNNLSI
ncbi:hypothetical protein [Pediococcus pentosaceus]|uniref:hypothetical protein n=1 Tax=Pediococcus pentosaceus TaxID=1255 RepID=UPI0018A170A7|nr:hypothetical protein [Pediococcus pentosaceus]MBF7123349.1 hypothetical protein [Pediococcus pentosaceus]MCV3326500.1 hypothetical protein [Pediococcus pentosaceus]